VFFFEKKNQKTFIRFVVYHKGMIHLFLHET